MSISFDDIPFEVLLNFIMPHISIKEVGALAMVNPVWRDMCNDNETWKILYLRTVRAKVVDTSVHIGARGFRCHQTLMDPHARGRIIYEKGYKPYQPFTLGSDLSCQFSRDLLHNGSGAKCIPDELRDKLLPWKDVRTDGFHTNEFWRIPSVAGGWWGPNRDTKSYCEYIQKEWREYNKSKGFSTVNLCQCADHYVFESLDVPGACRNYKSFKKMTLKKHGTCAKHAVKRAACLAARERKKYEKMLQIMERAKTKYESANQNFQQKKSLCEKISNSIE